MDTEPLLLTIDEAAARLRIKRSLFYELIRRGEIRSVVVGSRARRVSPRAVEEYARRLETGQVAG
jgi:excisionase family DNA binding protein